MTCEDPAGPGNSAVIKGGRRWEDLTSWPMAAWERARYGGADTDGLKARISAAPQFLEQFLEETVASRRTGRRKRRWRRFHVIRGPGTAHRSGSDVWDMETVQGEFA